MDNRSAQKWYALEISAEPEAAEAVEHALNELNALGTEINHLRRKADEAVTIVGYFNELPHEEFLQDELHHALRIYDLDENSLRLVERKEVADQDWLREWKKHWKPSVVGRFVITPPWEEVKTTDQIVISIEPNMAFGTGTHETTQLCLRAIEEHFRPGLSFMDVGTGTGILAIAAAKLSAAIPAKFFACDTDADSVKIARENAILNNVDGVIEFVHGPISDDTPVFDFVCANLTIDVILPLLGLLLERSKQTLILSGILTDQEASIIETLTKRGVKDLSVERAGEWIAVTVNHSI